MGIQPACLSQALMTFMAATNLDVSPIGLGGGDADAEKHARGHCAGRHRCADRHREHFQLAQLQLRRCI